MTNIIVSIYAIFVFAIFFAILARWWIFQSTFMLAEGKDQKVSVIGYKADAGVLLKICAFIAFPLTSLGASKGTPVGPPVAGQGGWGPGAYTLLSFIFIKPLILYSFVVVPLAALVLLLRLLWSWLVPSAKIAANKGDVAKLGDSTPQAAVRIAGSDQSPTPAQIAGASGLSILVQAAEYATKRDTPKIEQQGQTYSGGGGTPQGWERVKDEARRPMNWILIGLGLYFIVIVLANVFRR